MGLLGGILVCLYVLELLPERLIVKGALSRNSMLGTTTLKEKQQPENIITTSGDNETASSIDVAAVIDRGNNSSNDDDAAATRSDVKKATHQVDEIRESTSSITPSNISKSPEFHVPSTSEQNVSIKVADVSNNKTATSPLNDQTIDYDATMHRPWLDDSVPNPPAMIVLTDYAWNQLHLASGQDLYRGYRTMELVEGLVNHPYFHPTGWQDLNSGKMEISNTTRYYIFLDYETCGEYGTHSNDLTGG